MMKVIAYWINGITLVCPGCMPSAIIDNKAKRIKSAAEIHGACRDVNCQQCGATIPKNREYGVWPPKEKKQ